MSIRPYVESADDKDKMDNFFYDYWQHKNLPRRYDLFTIVGDKIYVGHGDQWTGVFRWKSSIQNTGKYIVGFGGAAPLRYQLSFTEEYVKNITSIYTGPGVLKWASYSLTLSDFRVMTVEKLCSKIIKILKPEKADSLLFRYDIFTFDEDMELVLVCNKKVKLTYLHSSYIVVDVRHKIFYRDFKSMGFYLNSSTNKWYVDSTIGPALERYEDMKNDHLKIIRELKGVSDKIKEDKEKGVKLDALLEKKRGLEELLKDFREESGENFEKAEKRDNVTWRKIEEEKWVGDNVVETVYSETITNKDPDIILPVLLSTIAGCIIAKKIIG